MLTFGAASPCGIATAPRRIDSSIRTTPSRRPNALSTQTWPPSTTPAASASVGMHEDVRRLALEHGRQVSPVRVDAPPLPPGDQDERRRLGDLLELGQQRLRRQVPAPVREDVALHPAERAVLVDERAGSGLELVERGPRRRAHAQAQEVVVGGRRRARGPPAGWTAPRRSASAASGHQAGPAVGADGHDRRGVLGREHGREAVREVRQVGALERPRRSEDVGRDARSCHRAGRRRRRRRESARAPPARAARPEARRAGCRRARRAPGGCRPPSRRAS